MAKPLGERVATALSNDRINDRDLAAVQADAIAEAELQTAIAAAQERESVDLALASDDRTAAAEKAAEATRQAEHYRQAAEQIEYKLAARKASPKRRSMADERAAILAERDEIAGRFRAAFPVAIETIISLLTEVRQNSERMREAHINEQNAEQLARGIPRSWFVGDAEALKYSEMRIPNFAGSGRCWPLAELDSPLGDWEAQRRRIRKEVAKQAAEREAAKWSWYRLKPSGRSAVSFNARVILPNRGPEEHTKARGLYREPWSGGLARSEAARLAELGVTVEEIDRATAEAEQLAREAEKDAKAGVYYPYR